MKRQDWPRGTTWWLEGAGVLHVSVPFTWLLPRVRAFLLQRSWDWQRARVGGPAVALMPDYLAGIPGVEVGGDLPGVLQRVNPQATRTTTGCPRRCRFCAVGTGHLEPGGLRELADWPDLPVVVDNNLLAASDAHLERVFARLRAHGWADFNQGLDARLLTPERAAAITGIGRPLVRLACDGPGALDGWRAAFDMLRSAGLPARSIRTYALVGHGTEPAEAWARCRAIEQLKTTVNPQWFHPLNAMQVNVVTAEQAACGWTDRERVRLMRYWYRRVGEPREAEAA